MSNGTASTEGQQAPATRSKKQVVKLPIKMKDGRIVEFNEKQKVIKTWVNGGGAEVKEDEKPAAVMFDFSSGESRIVELNHGGLTAQYAAHGISQKFGDEGAGAETVDDFIYDFDELYDRTSKGEWRTTREGTGFGGISILAKALVEYSKQPIEAIREYLRGLSPQEKIGLRSDGSLKPLVDRLEAEKVKASPVDTKALLAKLPRAA